MQKQHAIEAIETIIEYGKETRKAFAKQAIRAINANDRRFFGNISAKNEDQRDILDICQQWANVVKRPNAPTGNIEYGTGDLFDKGVLKLIEYPGKLIKHPPTEGQMVAKWRCFATKLTGGFYCLPGYLRPAVSQRGHYERCFFPVRTVNPESPVERDKARIVKNELFPAIKKDRDLFTDIQGEISFGQTSEIIAGLSQLDRMIVEDCEPAERGILRQGINHPPKSDCKISSLAAWLEIDSELAASLDDALRVIDPESAIRTKLISACSENPAEIVRLIALAKELDPLDDFGPESDKADKDDKDDEDDNPMDRGLSWLYATEEVEAAKEQERLADAWLTASGEVRFDRYSSKAKMIAYELMSEDRPLAAKRIAKKADNSEFNKLLAQIGNCRLVDINALRKEARTTGLLNGFSGVQQKKFWAISEAKKAELLKAKAEWVAAYPYTKTESYWLGKIKAAKSLKQVGYFWSQYYQAVAGAVDMGRPLFLEHILKDALIARKAELTKKGGN